MSNSGHHASDLPGLIDLYLLRCEVEGKSPKTVRAYGETLRRFLRIAEEDRFPSDVSAIEQAHLYAYLGRYTSHSPELREQRRHGLDRGHSSHVFLRRRA